MTVAEVILTITGFAIERQDGMLACGILQFTVTGRTVTLPWSHDVRDPRQIVVKFYPAAGDIDVIRLYYEALADVLLRALEA